MIGTGSPLSGGAGRPMMILGRLKQTEGGKGGSEEATESRVRSEGHCSQSRPGDFIPLPECPPTLI